MLRKLIITCLLIVQCATAFAAAGASPVQPVPVQHSVQPGNHSITNHSITKRKKPVQRLRHLWQGFVNTLADIGAVISGLAVLAGLAGIVAALISPGGSLLLISAGILLAGILGLVLWLGYELQRMSICEQSNPGTIGTHRETLG